MRASQYKITLDVQSTQSQVCLVAAVGDTQRELVIMFSDGGVPFELSGTETAVIFIEGPYSTHRANCKVKDGGVYYKFDKFTCPEEGLHNCQLYIYEGELNEEGELKEGGEALWSPQFSMFVGPKNKLPMK